MQGKSSVSYHKQVHLFISEDLMVFWSNFLKKQEDSVEQGSSCFHKNLLLGWGNS